jgi:hypothetical protein
MTDTSRAHAEANLNEAKQTLPAGSNRDTSVAAVIALQGIGRALLAIETRLAGIERLLATRAEQRPSFEWEDLEDYEATTGIEAIDKALMYGDPVGLLKQHLERRERYDGRAAVLADLTALVESTPAGSPAHDGGAAWLERYRAGASVEEL